MSGHIKIASLAAALLVSSVSIGAVAASTAAEAGQITVHITPHGKDARTIRRGLALYSLVEGIKNGARISQNGNGNAAAASQSGSGNLLGVIQSGNGHSATVAQSGSGNAFGLIQFGKNTNGNFSQNGNGNLDLVLQGGW